MHPRLARAGPAALVVLLATTTATVGPAAAQGAPTPTLEGMCWMGPNRPIFRLSNHGTEPLDYTFRAGAAIRSGGVLPAEPAQGRASAYFVGHGQFPTAASTEVAWWTEGNEGRLKGEGTQPLECTYNLRPAVRFLDAAGRDIPPPPSVASVVIELRGSLEQLRCTWNGSGLACTEQLAPASPLPPPAYRAAPDELQVPAFTVGGVAPWYTLRVVAPEGYRAVAGVGSFALADVGSGLGQVNVDGRLQPFFSAPGQPGSRDRSTTVTFAPPSLRIPTTTVPVTTPPTTTGAPASTTTNVATPTTVAPASSTTAAPVPVASVSGSSGGLRPSSPATLAALVAGSILAALGVAWVTGRRRRRHRRDATPVVSASIALSRRSGRRMSM